MVLKIPNQMWVVENQSNMGYLTHVDNTKAFQKRMQTGIKWARGSANPTGKTFENTPTEGFSIVSYRSRSTTDNKLLVIRDPRGFDCEITVSNLVDLAKQTTIINGIFQCAMVWGRDGVNNVLVAVDSTQYTKALADEKSLGNLVKVDRLMIGDKISLFGDDTQYLYLGLYEVEWTVKRHYRRSTSNTSWEDYTAEVKFSTTVRMMLNTDSNYVEELSSRAKVTNAVAESDPITCEDIVRHRPWCSTHPDWNLIDEQFNSHHKVRGCVTNHQVSVSSIKPLPQG